jgi:hypothetical protein
MVAASAYMIVFRLIHILAGTIWVGSVALVVLYIQPSAKAAGPAAGPFMQELLAKRRLPIFQISMGVVTVAAGLFLYWRNWQAAGSLGDWVGTSYGFVLTVGAVGAIAALLIGIFGLKPTIDRTLALGAAIASGPQPPPPERMAEVQSLQLQARRLSIAAFVLLVFAVLAMATARYW